MKTPSELLEVMGRYTDTGSFIALYKEARGYAKLYQEVMQEALKSARAGMKADGVTHHKDDLGSAGWSQPKRPRLNKAKWQEAMRHDSRLKALQDEFDALQAKLEKAQEEMNCLELPEAKFFIR